MNDMPATASQIPQAWGVDLNAVDALCHARFGDPFAILGRGDRDGRGEASLSRSALLARKGENLHPRLRATA